MISQDNFLLLSPRLEFSESLEAQYSCPECGVYKPAVQFNLAEHLYSLQI